MASLADISRLAGVSIATASRVLGGSSHPVSEATRNRVMQAADELGYRPSELARALVKRTSRIVGVIVGDVVDPYFAEIARGVEDVAARRGHLTMICNADRRPAAELAHLSVLRDYHAAGVVFAGSGYADESRAIADAVDRPPGPRSRRRGAGGARARLPARARGQRRRRAGGRRAPARPRAPPDRVRRRARRGCSRARSGSQGFEAAMQAAGAESVRLPGGFEYEAGDHAADELLAAGPLPDAILAVNDEVAIGLLTGLRRGGVVRPGGRLGRRHRRHAAGAPGRPHVGLAAAARAGRARRARDPGRRERRRGAPAPAGHARDHRAAARVIAYPPELPVSARRADLLEAIAQQPGRDRGRRDRLGQDHAAAEAVPGGGPRADRPHAAAAAGRAHGRRADRPRDAGAAGRGGRLRRALQRPLAARHADPADDRRPAAGRGRARQAAAPLRHGDRRRGARAQPQRRLPARLPGAHAAAAARPEGRDHVGDDRPRALQPPLRRRPDRRGLGPHVPGRGPLPAAARARRRPHGGDRRRGRGADARRHGGHAGVPQRRARDPRHGRRAGGPAGAAGRRAAAVRPAVGHRPVEGLQTAQRGGAWSWPRTSRRRR